MSNVLVIWAQRFTCKVGHYKSLKYRHSVLLNIYIEQNISRTGNMKCYLISITWLDLANFLFVHSFQKYLLSIYHYPCAKHYPWALS